MGIQLVKHFCPPKHTCLISPPPCGLLSSHPPLLVSCSLVFHMHANNDDKVQFFIRSPILKKNSSRTSNLDGPRRVYHKLRLHKVLAMGFYHLMQPKKEFFSIVLLRPNRTLCQCAALFFVFSLSLSHSLFINFSGLSTCGRFTPWSPSPPLTIVDDANTEILAVN